MSGPLSIDFATLPSIEGRMLGPGDWLGIDQGRIDLFATATGDRQWIHVDVERAAARGGTIAHGLLILSMIPALSEALWDVTGIRHALNYGFEKIRFPASVTSGGRIRLMDRIIRVEAKGDALAVTTNHIVAIEGSDRPACVADGVVWYYGA